MPSLFCRLFNELAACETGLAFAVGGVAEGLVERAVGSLFRVGENARDDESGFVVEVGVSRLALSDLLPALVVYVVNALARVATGFDDRLEVRDLHSAERLFGSERAPAVEHPFHAFFVVFRTCHRETPFRTRQGRAVEWVGVDLFAVRQSRLLSAV